MNIRINVTRKDGVIETVEWKDVCINHIRRVDTNKRAIINRARRYLDISNNVAQNIFSPREFFDIKGGTTIIAYTRNGKSRTTLSTCSPTENFCRRTGIGAAVANFVANHIKTGPYIMDSFEYPDKGENTYTFNFISDDKTTDKFWYLRAIARTRKANRLDFLNPRTQHDIKNI